MSIVLEKKEYYTGLLTLKMFYEWIFIIFALPTFCQEYPEKETNFIRLKNEKVNSFKVQLRKKIDELINLRRSVMEGNRKLVPVISSRLIETGNREILRKGCIANVDGSDVVFVVTSRNVLSMLQNVSLVPIQSFPLHRAFLSLQAVKNGRTVWLIAQHTNKKNRHFVNIYGSESMAITLVQRLNLGSPSFLSTTKFGYRSYIATAFKSTTSAEFRLYEWIGTQFDKIFWTQMDNNCSGLTIWNIDGTVYVALSFIASGRVQIKQFIENSEDLINIQLIDVYAYVMKSFEDSGSHYLICGTLNSVVIYWWTGSVFRLMHSKLFAKKITDVSTYWFNERLMIAVVFEHEVEFLVQDSSAQFMVVGSQTFDPSETLKSILLWKRGGNIYMLPLFKEDHSIAVYEVSLEFEISEPETGRSLEDCVKTLGDYVYKRDEKINEIGSIVKNTWSSSTPFQISSLTVKGTVKSLTNSTIHSLYFDSNVTSPVALDMMNVELMNTIEVIQTELPKSILKSEEQYIQSDMHFTNLTVGYGQVRQLPNHINLNKVATSRLIHALKTKGHQIFPYNTGVIGASCSTVNTDFLNGNNIEDFVLLNSGSWKLTGDITFGNVSAKNVFVKNLINGVDLKNIVLTWKEQNINGLKVFKSLKASSVWTTDRNEGEISLDRLKGVVYLNSKNFNVSLNFNRTLGINGNLRVSSLNGNRLSHLHFNSVKKNDEGNIHGFKSFKSVIIEGNVTIFGGINDFILHNLMTVNTDQNITGVVTFSNTTHCEDVLTNSLNGLDLSSKAVLKFEPNSKNEIKGVKTFQENLKVSDIVMKEGIKIDSFDPSPEISEIMLNVQNSGNSSAVTPHWFNKMTVGGIVANNIEVDESNFPVLKELDNVWLRTIEQNISFLETQNMTVYQLQVSNVNRAAVKDLVPVNEESTINAPINFTEDVKIHTLNLREGANANFSSGFWNPNIKVKILGNITIEDPILKGNLNVTGAFKNFEMGLMNNTKQQTVKGTVNFEKIELKELNLTSLKAGIVNKVNITKYYERSVPLSKKIRISNKTFKELSGIDMDCKGTLNNVSIDRLATINTEQKLVSSYEFQNSTSFKQVYVKRFFGGLQIKNVVYTDRIGNMSNKYFNGSVETSHLTASGNISGVDITRLQLEAFNKTADNNMSEKLTFLGNLGADEIQVIGNNRIDGINLKNLIGLKKSMQLNHFNGTSIRAGDVIINGNINGCNWMSTLQNAVTLKQVSQNITSKLHVYTLEIRGNLSVGYLNGANIQEWIFLFNATSTSGVQADVIFENLKTENVYIPNTVNLINFTSLFRDYVSQSEFQIITGKKNFQSINVSNATIDVLNSNKTCGIDISELYQMSINKSTESDTLVFSNLTLKDLEAKNLIVAGMLNYLKLPDDVVLSNTSELIENEVIISSFNASQGLNVSGKIDEVQLGNFLEKRLTLNAGEVISNELVFEDDIYITENCSINGTVNKISLEEIVNVFQNQSISGTKNFIEEFWIKTQVTVEGYVNELVPDHLKKNLLMATRNESLKDLVSFSSLNTSSLTCDTINGIGVSDFYNRTHLFVHYIYDKLYNFTTDIQSHQELLRKQRDSVEHPLSLYSAFELHKILNLGLIERFLPVYEYGTYGPKYDLQVTQMIMWLKSKDPCRKMISLIADVMKDGTFNITNKIKGKIFPFSLKVEKENIIGFSVQAEHVRRCSFVGKKTHIVVKTLYFEGKTEDKIIQSPVNTTLLDVQLLEVEEIFLIIAYSNTGPSARIFVYQYDTINTTWSSHQQFHFQDLTLINIISVERDTDSLYEPPSVYLSVSGDYGNPEVTIYEWDFNSNEFILKTNVSTSVPSHAIWIENDHSLYLLLAKEMDRTWKDNTRVKIFTEPLEVYTLEEELLLNHTVNVKGVSSLEMFGLADDTFVLATNTHVGTVYVLQFRGYNGFELIQEIPSPGVTETCVFTVDNHLYLALNSRTGPSRILKAVVRGGRQGWE